MKVRKGPAIFGSVVIFFLYFFWGLIQGTYFHGKLQCFLGAAAFGVIFDLYMAVISSLVSVIGLSLGAGLSGESGSFLQLLSGSGLGAAGGFILISLWKFVLCALKASAQVEVAATVEVSHEVEMTRDPCPFCGVRPDPGYKGGKCAHCGGTLS